MTQSATSLDTLSLSMAEAFGSMRSRKAGPDAAGIVDAIARVNDEEIDARGLTIEVSIETHAEGGMAFWFEAASATADAIASTLGFRDQIVVDDFEVVQDILPLAVAA